MVKIKRGQLTGWLRNDESPLKIITINVSRLQLAVMERLIEAGLFVSRSEGMRVMLNEFLIKKVDELYKMKDIKVELEGMEEEQEEDVIKIPREDGTFEEKRILGRGFMND